MQINLTITQSDIEHGECGEPCRCPVAFAVGRFLRRTGQLGKYAWSVSHRSIHLWSKDASLPSREAILPEKVAEWVEDFDARRAVKPFKAAVAFGTFPLK